MKKSDASQDQSASELISKRIADLGEWRGETLGRVRKFIRQADPDVVEEWKWMGTPVWSHDGIVRTGEFRLPASFRQNAVFCLAVEDFLSFIRRYLPWQLCVRVIKVFCWSLMFRLA